MNPPHSRTSTLPPFFSPLQLSYAARSSRLTEPLAPSTHHQMARKSLLVGLPQYALDLIVVLIREKDNLKNKNINKLDHLLWGVRPLHNGLKAQRQIIKLVKREAQFQNNRTCRITLDKQILLDNVNDDNARFMKDWNAFRRSKSPHSRRTNTSMSTC